MQVKTGNLSNLLLIFALLTLSQTNIWAQTVVTRPDAVSGAAQEKPSRTYGKANKETLKCFVVLLRLRHDLYGKWKDTRNGPVIKKLIKPLVDMALTGMSS